MTTGLANFEETVITMIGNLTELERNEFVGYTEETGRRAPLVWYAAWAKSPRLLQVLIAAKAPIDKADGARGRTAFWEAASQGDAEMVDTLLLLRANVNAKSFDGAVAGDGKGSSALRMAEKRGHDTVVTLLLAARADADVASSSNWFEAGSASKEVAPGVETNVTCVTVVAPLQEQGYSV